MTGLINWFSQIISVTAFGFQSLPKRLGSSLTAMLGIAGVVAVMVAVLSIAQGIMQTMENSASIDNVVVLRSGATSEMMSGLSGDEARYISEGPGLVRNDSGSIASPAFSASQPRPTLMPRRSISTWRPAPVTPPARRR